MQEHGITDRLTRMVRKMRAAGKLGCPHKLRVWVHESTGPHRTQFVSRAVYVPCKRTGEHEGHRNRGYTW